MARANRKDLVLEQAPRIPQWKEAIVDQDSMEMAVIVMVDGEAVIKEAEIRLKLGHVTIQDREAEMVVHREACKHRQGISHRQLHR